MDRQPTIMELFDKIEIPESNTEIDEFPEEIQPEIVDTTNTKENIDAYAALFFDGEGYIGTTINKSTNPPSIRLRIDVVNTDFSILTKLKEHFGGEIYVRKKPKEYYKKTWNWHINDKIILKQFLQRILPYSTVKKSQIELGLKFLEITTNIKYRRGGISIEEYTLRQLISDKLKELKHVELSVCELDSFNKQIKEMNIDKEQPSLSKWFDSDVKPINLIKKEIEPEKIIEDVRRITDVEACAFFDGEGCITTGENKGTNPHIIFLFTTLTNTDLPILTKLKQEYGGKIRHHKKPKGKEHWKDSWNWDITDRLNIKKFLIRIYPYSTIKKSQIELGLKFLELTSNHTGGRAISTEECKLRNLISNKLKELKHTNLSQCELNTFNTQIKEMNIDKNQHTMLDY